MEAVYISVLGAFIKQLLDSCWPRSSEGNHFPWEQVVGQEKLLPKTGLWTGLLLEELSGLTTVAFRDTAIKFVCSHTQPALLASLVLWLRQTRFTLEKDTSLVKIFRIMAGVTFWLLPFTVSETHEKKSDWIYFIWQCEDRSQRRNLKDENSPEP